jgi:serine/threonine protein kinase/lipoprotein NlpI
MAVKCPKCQTDNPSDSKYCKACATLLPSSRDVESFQTKTLETPREELTTGSTFAARYQIIEELGHGGMGRVYRAVDKKLNEEVALKLIMSEIATNKSMLERFHNEIKLARKISHPHVGRMYDLLEENGIHFITMEYVPGEDLKSSIRRFGQLPFSKSISIAKQICEGLAEAHKTGVVHRDLKPSNIMVDKEGNAKVMDFGIARSIHSKSITGEGTVIGTPEYMSPEQAEGKEADQRSDIYSLGIILYEMVTGKVPFEGNTPLSIAMKHKLAAPRDPKELVSQLPENLSLLILKCLEKNREKRYQDAEELRRELEKIETRTTVTEPLLSKKKPLIPAGLAGITAKIKWKKVALFGGIGVFLALVVISKLLMFKGKEEVLDSIAVLPFENVNADPDAEYLCDGITETLINKLSQLSVFKKVISRASSFAYKGEKIDPKKVGRELGVKTVLTARMVRFRETISISPALVKASDNSQLWGERYERKFQDIFAIEEEITSAIITALRLKLTGEEKKKISERRIDNVQAYEFYLKAKREIGLWTKEGCDRALQYLGKGLEIVGENAMLNAGIGYAYYSCANLGIMGEENGKKAEIFANKALEMDPESSEAHLVLGLVNSAFFGNQQKGVYHLKKALAANPNDGDIMWWLCVTYAFIGKMAAVERIAERMSDVDPLNPQTVPAKTLLYQYGGQLDLAFERTSKAPPLDPPGLFMYAWLLIYKKGLKEAEAIIEKNIEDPKQNLMWQLYFLLKYAAKGDRKNFSRGLSPELLYTVKRDPQYSSFMADFYALLGDREKALDWLENAVSRGFFNYPYLNDYDPYLGNIRGEGRFRKLMEKLKSEWEQFEE